MNGFYWLREVPTKWWAVFVGVLFGSLALISIDGPRKGYTKAVWAAALTGPLLSVIAGALLPKGASLEMAALIGGVVAVSGTSVILAVSRAVPPIVSAALTGAAQSYLKINPTPPGEPPEANRYNIDGTPDFPMEDQERLLRELDKD